MDFRVFLVLVWLPGSFVALPPAAAADQSVAATGVAQDRSTDQATEDDRIDAEDEILAGHSYHGEFLNEGPRQAAYLMGGTGEVSFPVTSDNPQVRPFIEQGLGQLYGFWYLEAERSFRHAAQLDPQCAIAYWGAALATHKAPERARGFIAEATARKDSASRREQMYIEALDAYLNFGRKPAKGDAVAEKQDASEDAAKPEGDGDDESAEKSLDAEQKKQRAEKYTKALEGIALEYPEDVEALALLALQLYENRGELPNPSYLAVDALMDRIFAAQPLHPAHHFRIHHWDHKKPELALRSAALCGESAPAIAHMWHMPGHIYSRLKRYDDAVWQQEASARVDHAHMMRDRVLPDQIHNFAHNNEWLIRNLVHVGRVRDAVDLAKNMIELPQHPKYNTLDKRGSAYYGRLRLTEVLNQYELWDEAVELCTQPYLEPTDREKEQVDRLRLLGSARFMTGDAAGGRTILEDLRQRLGDKQAERDEAVEQAEAKTRAGFAPAETDAEADAKETEADAKETEADAKVDGAALTAEQKKKLEKARGDAGKPFKTPIGNLEKALAQVEAFQHLARDDYDAALPHLEKAGRNVSPLLVARARLMSGDPAAAIEAAEKEVKRNKNEVLPLAYLTELHYHSGDWSAARESFDQLREISSSIDLQAPVFQRLDRIAARLGYQGDWRQTARLREDLGQRPELDSLGPFRWQPSPAPSWKLVDAQGDVHTLDDYRGRPLVVIFYLGFGCLHCAEQLQDFAPYAEKYAQAGIEILAVSSAGREDLKQGVELYDGDPLPFTITSDTDLQTFKAYRAFDDFENQPLHGTFLIDGEGRVRWQDIGYEPFMQPGFLLDEAQRLLGQSQGSPETPQGSEIDDDR
ncbi:redoxin domain-containing protein [Roseimaritima sediminicola]|uniref:redoxin domain-containing protein n=1 Tax=Roseimaritima sediminicola TaxID=2662066 RepID=UPI00129836F6|nr:redoxin domain-containing protein [Roseimaritima sediminicola]